MKRASKNYIIIVTAVFLIGVLFAACTGEEVHLPVDKPVGDGYSLLQVSIKNTRSATYAPDLFEAYPQEKEIRSVALFTQTDDVGEYGQPGFQAGAFGRFFSEENPRTTHGLHEPLEHVGGNYTATIRVKNDGFGTRTQLVVIANYAENGLAETLKNILTWGDLKDVLTNRLDGKALATPLLMYGSDYNVALTEGGTAATSVLLSRVVARLDVINKAVNLANPNNGFVLHSVQFLHPKEFSFLLPGNRQSALIPTIASSAPVLAGNSPENDPAKITGLYLYETDNQGTESGKTSVLLKGLLFGSPFEREILLKKPNKDGRMGDPINLQRNYRYQLTITGIEGEELEWDVDILDWSATTPIPASPTYAVPELTDFMFQGVGAAYWIEDTKTFVYEGRQVEKIFFKASGLHHTIYDFRFEHDVIGRSLGLHFSNSDNYKNLVKRGEAVLTGNVVSQEYEITLPPLVNLAEATPIYIKLYIRNAGDPHYADSITVKCVPDYMGLPGMKPVLVGGKYWAPLNVGATKIDLKTVPALDTYGYYFQRGRNTPFHPTEGFAALPEKVSYYDATEGIYKDVFISIAGSPWEWLLGSDIEGKEKRDKLWSAEVNQSPCPKGWRVPTILEFTKFIAKAPVKKDKYTVIAGDEPGEELYLPLCGNIHSQKATYENQGTSAYYWALPVPPSIHDSFYHTQLVSTTFRGPSHGFPIRCIQDAGN